MTDLTPEALDDLKTKAKVAMAMKSHYSCQMDRWLCCGPLLSFQGAARPKVILDLIDEIKRLETEFAQSERDLQNFPEEARRAGALPGWFRDDGPAAPATNEGTVRARRGRAGGSESLSQRGATARQMQSEPAEAAESDTSDRQEDPARSRRSLSSRRAEEREGRRLSK